MASYKAVKLINGMYPQEIDVVNDSYELPGTTMLPTLKSILPATTGAMTVSMGTGLSVYTITPTGACTFNASGGAVGMSVTFIITSSGASSFVLTWGTNFKTVSTLATGTTTGKMFCISFIYNGVLWVETARTAGM